MRKAANIVFLSCLLSFSVYAADLRVESPEIYVELNPAAGYLYIKEYYLSTLETDEDTIGTQLASLKDLVGRAGYCTARFHLAAFSATQEALFQDGGAVTAECHLFTNETSAKRILEDAFGGVLNRQVSVTISDSDIGLHFEGSDIQVRGTNAKGVYGKGPRRVIFWPAGVNTLETVFGSEARELDDFRSLGPYLSSDVSSPEESKGEIQARLSRAAEQLIIDGSTAGGFQESISALYARLDEPKRKQFREAMLRLATTFDLPSAETRSEASAAYEKKLQSLLDGKTLAEVLELSDAVSLDEEAAEEFSRAAREVGEMGTGADYQHDADIVRLKHVRYLGGLIEEYRGLTGAYPLSKSSDTPNYVFIASPSQQRYVSPLPIEHTSDEVETLKEELERILERDIVMPFDPQLFPVNKPNFYVYMTRGARYFLSVHLHDGTDLGRELGPYYFKLEISDLPIPEERIMTYDSLLADSEFKRRVGADYKKPVKWIINPEQEDVGIEREEGL